MHASAPEGAVRGWWRWLMLSAVVVIADLASKDWIESNLRLGDSITLTSWFNIVRAHNTGAAFSFLANAGGWQRVFFVTVTLAVAVGILWYLRKSDSRRFSAALALVLGGAIGNLYDRVTLGYVVDFVQWHYGGYAWPAFNVADSAICAGVALLILDSFLPGRRDRPAATEPS